MEIKKRKVKIVFRQGLTHEKIEQMKKYWYKQKGIMGLVCSNCRRVRDKMTFVKPNDSDDLYIIPICDICFNIDEELEILEIDLVPIKK